MGLIMSKIEIRHEYDHYAVYVDDEFYCSADTYSEAEDDLESVIIDEICS